MELKHSGSIAHKDLSEVSDEELMSMIYTFGAGVGLAPMKTIDAEPEPPGPDSCLNSTDAMDFACNPK